MFRDKINEIRRCCPHCKTLEWMELLNMECGVVGQEKQIFFSADVNPKATKFYGKKNLLDDFTESEYGL